MPVDRQGKGKLSTLKVKSSILRHIVSISNPLVVDAACGAGLSGAQRARRRWACHRATVPRYRGIGSEAYLNGTS
jgi:hypothetical protein